MEASLQDYEILYKENPDNEEVAKAMKDVQVGLKRNSGGSLDINNSNVSRDSDRNDAQAPQKVVAISCEEQFRNCIAAPGNNVLQRPYTYISNLSCFLSCNIYFKSSFVYFDMCGRQFRLSSLYGL